MSVKVQEIKDFIMHQFMDMEPEDVREYLPYLMVYVNEGYEKLVHAWAKVHVGSNDFPRLVSDNDVPAIPERYHKLLCDWATWCMYRNGNAQKQNRGQAYLYAFQDGIAEILNSGGEAVQGDEDGDGLVDRTGKPVLDIRHFHGIPR